MAISSRRAGAARLRQAVDAYRTEQKDKLDQHARAVLDRLAGSPKAAKAFEGLWKEGRGPRIISSPRSNYSPEQKAAELVTICIEADGYARAFGLEIAKAETVLVRAERFDKAVAELRKFVAEVAEQRVQVPSSVLTLSIFDPPADISALKDALDLIARWIDWSRGVAEANIAQLGATRKRRSKEAADKTAADNAAIWCLGAQVRTVVGWPHWQEVAVLAQVILKTEVDRRARAPRRA